MERIPRKRKPFLFNPEDLDEESEGKLSAEVDRPTEDERKMSTELIVFLENELALDARRIRVRYRGGVVYVQGTVEDGTQKRAVEKLLAGRPRVREVESSLTVQSGD